MRTYGKREIDAIRISDSTEKFAARYVRKMRQAISCIRGQETVLELEKAASFIQFT